MMTVGDPEPQSFSPHSSSNTPRSCPNPVVHRAKIGPREIVLDVARVVRTGEVVELQSHLRAWQAARAKRVDPLIRLRTWTLHQSAQIRLRPPVSKRRPERPDRRTLVWR
jgi:hypothetical protein